jgi:hypothetical protein
MVMCKKLILSVFAPNPCVSAIARRLAHFENAGEQINNWNRLMWANKYCCDSDRIYAIHFEND